MTTQNRPTGPSLRELAEAAPFDAADRGPKYPDQPHSVADYFAALSPSVVLALLAELEQLRAIRDAASKYALAYMQADRARLFEELERALAAAIRPSESER